MVSRAQGTIEYIVIIAIVVVLALVVVGVLINQTSSAGNVSSSVSKAYWQSQPLAITDSLVDSNGNLIITLKNNTSELGTITSVVVNGTTVYLDSFDSFSVAMGETKTVYLNKPSLGATTNNQISINYTNSNGLTKTQTGTTKLSTNQITTITPASTVIISNPNNCFDWNGAAAQHTICTCNDLNTIDYNSTTRGWTYILQNDFDFRNCDASYTTGTGWDPIGDNATYPFTGTFNGGNKRIKNLYINRPTTDNVGLFGYSTGTISSIGLIDSNVTGNTIVGSLVGYRISGTISASYSTGNVRGSSTVGGILGSNNNPGSVTSSYFIGNVTGTGDNVGGIVGYNYYNTSITNSYTTGNVTGSSNVGGVVGYNYNSSSVTSCHFIGNVIGTGSNVGGIAGYNYYASITKSYATGNVTGTGNNVGGIIGYWSNRGTVSNNYTTSKITGNTSVGGLVGSAWSVGWNAGVFTNNYSTGDVNGRGTSVGGFIGDISHNVSLMNNNYATGEVTGTGGGFVGSSVSGITYTNCWYYNARADSQPSGITKDPSGKSSFYSSSHGVYTGSPTWDFVTVWGINQGSSYPYLR